MEEWTCLQSTEGLVRVQQRRKKKKGSCNRSFVHINLEKERSWLPIFTFLKAAKWSRWIWWSPPKIVHACQAKEMSCSKENKRQNSKRKWNQVIARSGAAEQSLRSKKTMSNYVWLLVFWNWWSFVYLCLVWQWVYCMQDYSTGHESRQQRYAWKLPLVKPRSNLNLSKYGPCILIQRHEDWVQMSLINKPCIIDNYERP